MKRYALVLSFAMIVPMLLAACKTPARLTPVAPPKDKIAAEVQKATFTSKGELVTEISAPAARVLPALRSAIAKEGFKIASEEPTAGGGTAISAWSIDPTPDLQQEYRVRLTPNAGATKISIHFGRFGHEVASKSLLYTTLLEMSNR